jgi:AcrR family transcriptional regulator
MALEAGSQSMMATERMKRRTLHSALSDTVSHNVDPSSWSSTRDARAVKSGTALRAALLALIERKPLDQITVREIAAEANVHYATFFRHHATKEALLDSVAAEQIDHLVALTMPVLDSVDRPAAVLALGRYVDEHRLLWTALLTGGAAGAMREELLRISRTIAEERAPQESWIPVDLAVNCTVSLIFETLAWWLAPAQEGVSIERVADMLDRLLSSIQPF